MADNKKYYYLKIKENFYETEDMKILQAMDNGYLYSDILMKLYLKSLKTDGKLMFKDNIPYSPKMIATITNHNIDTVDKALCMFRELGLIEVLDNGAIYMLDIQSLIGKSSSEADRKRDYRNRIKEEKNLLLGEGDKCPDTFGTNSDERSREIELEKEIELDIELEKELDKNISKDILCSTFIERLIEKWNSLNLTSKLTKITSGTNRHKMLKARVKQYSEDEVLNAIDEVNESKFLKGQAKDFEITFDWFIKPNNFLKVIEGNYKDKQIEKQYSNEKPKLRFNNFKGRDYDYDDLEKKLLGWDD